MIDTLLRELTNTDLDWMIRSGTQERLPKGQQLFDPSRGQDVVYLMIEGRLGLTFSSEVEATDQSISPIDVLEPGEIIGTGALFDIPERVIFRTLQPSILMSFPIAKLQEKLEKDIAFAAHFHRAVAVMLSDRLRRIFEHPDRIRFWGERSAREVLTVFGELRDSDIDWLISFGQTEVFKTDQVLVQAGRPVDSLCILLDGQMALSAPEGNFNPLYLCFSGLENRTREQKAFARVAKGSMPGIMSFLDFRPLPITIRAIKESLVFAISRQMLATKLQADNSFASRLYRVIAIETLDLLQAVGARLVDSTAADVVTDEEASDGELDIEAMQQMSDGAKRFNWMLSQLGVIQQG